jgi:TolA-binding protein
MQNYYTALDGDKKDEIAARSQFQTGECLFALREYDEAVKAFVKVEVNYNYPLWTARALLEMGQVLTEQGKKDLAVEQFKKVISQYPGSESAVMAKELLESSKGLK